MERHISQRRITLPPPHLHGYTKAVYLKRVGRWQAWYCVNNYKFVRVSQVLGIPPESGCLLDELHEIYHQLALPPLPLHRCLRSPRNAALWRQVRARG